jgi:hypothetical protein
MGGQNGDFLNVRVKLFVGLKLKQLTYSKIICKLRSDTTI